MWNKRIINHHELWQCNNLKFPSILTPSAAQFRSRFCDLKRLMEAAPISSWVTAASSHSEEEKSSWDSRRWLDMAHLNFRAHATPSPNATLHRHHQWTRWLITFRSLYIESSAAESFFCVQLFRKLECALRRTLSRCQSPMRCNNGPNWCVEAFKSETARLPHLLIRRRWKVGISSWKEEK